MKQLFHLLFAVLLGTAALPLAAEVKVGEEAPYFQLDGADESVHSLKKHAGKIIVLEWVNHGCPFVKKHYESGNMQALQREFTERGVVWLSICSSAPGKQGYMEPAAILESRAGLRADATAYLIDADGDVGMAYGAKRTPEFVIIDEEGIVRYHGAIDSNPSANPDDIAKATPYVKNALEALLAGEPVPEAQTRPYGCSVKY